MKPNWKDIMKYDGSRPEPPYESDISICKFGCSSIDGCQGHCERFDTLAELHGGRGMTLREIMEDESPTPPSAPKAEQLLREARSWIASFINDKSSGQATDTTDNIIARIDAFLRGSE